MGINAREFCDHGYTKIKICPSCLKEKDDQIQSLRSQLSLMEEALKSIPAVDKTPEYDYGNGDGAKNRRLELPGVGKRWKTPREIAQEALSSRAGGEGKNG